MTGAASFALAPQAGAALGPARGLDALLFDTGKSGRAEDPVRVFLREDAPALDWRTDFLRSDFLDRLFEAPEDETEREEDEDIVTSKDALVTTGQVGLDADSA